VDAAKALDASSNANPRITLFDTDIVANFMTAPFSFFFPENASGSGWGGPSSRLARKLLCFAANRLQFSRRGSADRPRCLPLCMGFSHLGRQTEREKIPDPAKKP
jgi:hypothetical protein